ncbi:MAG: TlpA family protein disulfide reductase [Burkholderiales bacterium]|nr:TlpA family protein disulfide reductase [Burkholderiales bacterium]
MKRREFLMQTAVGGLVMAAPMAMAQPSASAPDANQKFSLTGFDDTSSRIIRLENFLGKVCLISFFTSGCNLCNHDLKLMREFYVSNRKKDFVLIGVNMDESKADFEDYKRLVALSVPKEQNFPILWRKGPEYVDNFGIIKTKPTHFVLDKTQKLMFRREGTFGPDDWNLVWDKIGKELN